MSKLVVSNIQRLCVSDGPGVRTTVFLKGCTLQCPWCCNPETIHVNKQYVFDKGLCSYPEKKRYCSNCEQFGGEQTLTDCPVHAFESTETQYTSDELLQILLKDEVTYQNDGGVTFSGGEPLLQIKALMPVLQELKSRGVHIAFETTLYVPIENFDLALPWANYWLVDLKFQFGYAVNNEFAVPNDAFERNLQNLQQKVALDNICYRLVFMHEAMKNAETIVQKLSKHSIEKVELLECHSLAENKYRQLGMELRKFSAPTKEDMRILENLLKDNNLNYSYTRL